MEYMDVSGNSYKHFTKFHNRNLGENGVYINLYIIISFGNLLPFHNFNMVWSFNFLCIYGVMRREYFTLTRLCCSSILRIKCSLVNTFSLWL